MTRILDLSGTVLAEAELRVADDGMTLIAVGLARANGLLHYYFGKGGRLVRVEHGGEMHDGRLATRWQSGKRLWLVRLERPVAVPQTSVEEPRQPARPLALETRLASRN